MNLKTSIAYKILKTNVIALSLSIVALNEVQAASVIGGSDLMTGAYANQLESWLVNDTSVNYDDFLQFTNIFDKTSTSTSIDFHNAADGKGSTLTLMQVTSQSDNQQYIIGGFNPKSWSSIGDYNYSSNSPSDRTAFIFNLSTGLRLDQSNFPAGIWQTYNSFSYGPTFGGGHDIGVDYSLNLGYNYGYSYCADNGTSCGTSTLTLLGTHSLSYTTFTVNQLEVFTISQAPAVPGAVAGVGAFPTLLTLGGFAFWRRRRTPKAVAA